MKSIRPKKNLGQHFLKDRNIARKIVNSLGTSVPNVLEVGPGMGVLTCILLQRSELKVYFVEIDEESVEFLKNRFPLVTPRLYHANFLKWNAESIDGPFSVIGNFPYNISSQIFFKILELRNRIPEVVGMVQKEVAERLSASPGSKTYGILSVLLGAFYNIDYLFSVSQKVFTPPPKVESAVVRLRRNCMNLLPCSEKLFFITVKRAFNQRRKMLRNSLKEPGIVIPETFTRKRPEDLSVNDFIELTMSIETQIRNK